MQRFLAFVLVALCAFVAVQAWRKSHAGALDYYTDWSAAVEEAQRSGRPMLINFGGPW